MLELNKLNHIYNKEMSQIMKVQNQKMVKRS